MNRMDELATYTLTSDAKGPRKLVANDDLILNRTAVDLGDLEKKFIPL